MNGIANRTEFDRRRIIPIIGTSAIGKRYRVVTADCHVLHEGCSRKVAESIGCGRANDLFETMYLEREIGWPILGEFEKVAEIKAI